MGTWGTSLYSNDSTSDVRGTYLKFLERQSTNQEAYEKTLEECKEYLGDQEEALFWFALAETQWGAGRLMPEVKTKALEWIEKKGGLELWEENKKGLEGWKKTLEKLRIKLESEQPKEKRFRKLNLPNQNPWNFNDVYAYRIFNHNSSKEIDTLTFGKYILMQKIGEGQSFYSTDIVMRIQIYDRLFDKLPTIDDVYETIQNYRLLPFSYPSEQMKRYKRRLLGKPDPAIFNLIPCKYNPLYMNAKIEQYQFKQKEYNSLGFYPKDELTYICNIDGHLNKQHERTDGDADHVYEWSAINNHIGDFFYEWKDVEYEIIGDGIFEYPTREQQRQIKSELGIK